MSGLLNQAAVDFDIVELETGEIKSFCELLRKSRLPTLVLFYATWSNACVAEVELFEAWSKVNQKHQLANFVLINIDQNIGKALEFVDEINPTTGKPRVCRDYRDGDKPTVIHVGCADIPEPYGVVQVPHKLMIDEEGIVRRTSEDYHWDDIAGLIRHRHEETTINQTRTFLFPEETKTIANPSLVATN